MEWCDRCQKDFPSFRARQQHIADSPHHHVCYNCDDEPDFDDEDDLDEHLQSEHHICLHCDDRPDFDDEDDLDEHLQSEHRICLYCDDEPYFDDDEALHEHLENEHDICVQCDQKFSDSTELFDHDVAVHYRCKSCGKHNQSESNLKNHQKTHAKKDVKCFGCTRMFVTQSAMVLHLERSTCASGSDEDYVTEVAFDCYQSGHYTSDDPDSRFQCPTCETPFRLISGLLQHAESDICDEHLGSNRALAAFLHYLRWKMI
jgi:hypothetical protein